MQSIFFIGFILQIIVSVWTFLDTQIYAHNILILISLTTQSLSGLVFFFTLKKEIWNVAYILSILSSITLVILIVKANFNLVEIVSFCPLLFYYAAGSAYCSYKSKMQKLNKKIKEYQEIEKLEEDE